MLTVTFTAEDGTLTEWTIPLMSGRWEVIPPDDHSGD
jgi:hypothetical protein